MSNGINKVFLLGHVGNEVEVRETASGARIAKCSLATNRGYMDKSGNKQERTDWHRLTFFGKLADIAEKYVHKGDRIHVEGRIEYTTTESDGATKYWTDVIVSEMTMLGTADKRSTAPATKTADDPF